MNTLTRFYPAPERPKLGPAEVHLWRAELQSMPEGANDILSPDEWSRAGRFNFEHDRIGFIASRCLRRTILSRYIGIAPALLRFGEGPHGKPRLTNPDTALRFNVSHAGELFLMAIANAREVGVDVEALRENIPFETLADHYFAPTDAWSLRLVPSARKATTFFELWTSLEARLKAAGTGLHDSFPAHESGPWSLRSLTPATGYTAALAVEGDSFELNCWSWS